MTTDKTFGRGSLKRITLSELYEEIGRRREAGEQRTRGVPPSCECGNCPTCKTRERVRKHREKGGGK